MRSAYERAPSALNTDVGGLGGEADILSALPGLDSLNLMDEGGGEEVVYSR